MLNKLQELFPIHYRKGNVLLINADCMEVMKHVNGGYFDLSCVDPPYGIDVTKMNMGGRKTVKKDSSKSWDSHVPADEYFLELFRISKRQVIWGGNYFKLPCSQYFAIWDKGETMYGRDFAECEYAWVSSGGTRIYKTSPNDMFRIHPTQKPRKLYDWILTNYANKDQKILDTHLGSGSSAIASHYFGAGEFVGCELDSDYFKASVERFKRETAQETLF